MLIFCQAFLRKSKIFLDRVKKSGILLIKLVHYGERMKEAKYSAPSVKKAFKILHTIADSSTGLGVSELAKKLKIGKSTVHGLSLIHISEPTRRTPISYAVFCL